MALIHSRHDCRGSLALRMTAVMLIPFFIGCASKPMPAVRLADPDPTHQSSAAARPQADRLGTVEQQLRAAVGGWIGTPHKLGGNDHSGIDCSGFVQMVYLDVFNVRLPRSTALQVQTGAPIRLAQLRIGDLVFFHPPNKIRHVGVYLGRGEFAHASASRGVVISKLRTSYWQKCYWTSRRIIQSGG